MHDNYFLFATRQSRRRELFSPRVALVYQVDKLSSEGVLAVVANNDLKLNPCHLRLGFIHHPEGTFSFANPRGISLKLNTFGSQRFETVASYGGEAGPRIFSSAKLKLARPEFTYFIHTSGYNIILDVGIFKRYHYACKFPCYQVLS